MDTKAHKAWKFIHSYQKLKGYSPSLPEIKDAIKLKSLRGASLQLEKLEKLGYIERKKSSRRAIKLLVSPQEKTEELASVPLVGEIRAGMPILAEQNIEEYKKIPKFLLHGRTGVFLLKVKGDSMNKTGFLDGDIVIVGKQNTADNGDVVVAFIPEENTATLKRFKKMQEYVLLIPESYNPEYKPIIERNILIEGKVLDKLPQEYL